MLLEGLQLPLTTPFYPDGRLNLLKLEYNVARYSKTPVAGLVALGELGEPTMLSEDETRLVLRGVAGAAGMEKVLVAGVSRDSVTQTLDLAESAAKFGYDAVLVKQPSLFEPGAPGQFTKELLTAQTFGTGNACAGWQRTRIEARCCATRGFWKRDC